jgi:hypothetical protein
LLAEGNALDELASHMAEGFRGDRVRLDSSLVIGLLSGALGIVLVFWVLSRLVGGQDRRATCNSPGKLFVSLCRAHQLTFKDAWLLWRLARWQQLDDPARLFLEPEHFDPSGFGPRLTAHAQRLQSLRDRLFADLAQPESPPAVSTEEGASALPIAVPAGPSAVEASPAC